MERTDMGTRYVERRMQQQQQELRAEGARAKEMKEAREAQESRHQPEQQQKAWSEMSAVQRVSEAMKSTDREVGKAMVAALREMTDQKNIVVDNIKSFWNDVRRGYAAIQQERKPTQPAPQPRREPAVEARREVVTPAPRQREIKEVRYVGPEAMPISQEWERALDGLVGTTLDKDGTKIGAWPDGWDEASRAHAVKLQQQRFWKAQSPAERNPMHRAA